MTKMTPTIYGADPVDLGRFDLSHRMGFHHRTEMLFYLYLPVKAPGSWSYYLNGYSNLSRFIPLLEAVRGDLRGSEWQQSYIYLTAKVMPISPEQPGNRPGWHSDGFLSDDINYVWSDCSPTFFWQPEKRVKVCLPEDHIGSLAYMEVLTKTQGTVYPSQDNHLMKMDQTVIHRVGDPVGNMLRSFCKISVSKKKYDLVGNSISTISEGWWFHERSANRNHPAKAQSDSSM